MRHEGPYVFNFFDFFLLTIVINTWNETLSYDMNIKCNFISGMEL